MSDYQKLKAEYDKLKAKCNGQEFLIKQLTDLLITILDYNNFVKTKVVGLLGITGDNNE